MFEISAQPLDPAGLRASLAQPSAGALVVFEGWVRDHNAGQRVTSLRYEAAEELCRAEAETIFAEARQKFGVLNLRVVHRVGHLAVGEVAVWVGVAAGHRDAAFAACRYIIDEIKTRLPIWKKEFDTEGQARWIGS